MRPRALLVALAVFAAVGSSFFAQQAPVRQDLFVADDNYLTCRIPGLITTPKGSMLVYCEGRRGSRGDFANIDILYRRSADRGVTWSPLRVLVKLPDPQPRNPVRFGLEKDNGNDPDARTYHNCVMIPDRTTGSVHCLFCLDYWRCFYMRSDDDGLTFSPPREITDVVAGYRRKGVDWQLLGDGCGHGIQLASGRLVEALWLSHPAGGGHAWWYPANVGVLYSDDHGATWKIGDWAIRASAEFIHPNETCAVELADGRVLFNSRVEGDHYRRAITTTADVAGRWDPPRYDPALFDPHCEGSLLRVSVAGAHGRNRILFCNPDSENEPRSAPGGIGGQSRPRKNLTVRLSYDECRSWPISKVIDAGVAGYSDLTVSPDGTIFCIYEQGTTNGKQNANAALALFRFDLQWLTDGRDSGR